MTTVKGRWFVPAAVVLLVVVTWFGIREYRCKVRGAVLARQVESIKRDAAREIRVGASKAEVGHFFEQHNIPFEFLETEAYGSLRTVGCAPFGCGTDRAFKARRDLSGFDDKSEARPREHHNGPS